MASGKRKDSSPVTSVIIVLAILLVLNLISINLFARVDLTDSGIYSLSNASKNLMKNLSDRVLVKCFFTKDLPPPYNQNARYLKDQLADYRAYSGGKFEFEFIDPAEEGAEDEAQSYRIPPVQVNAYESDRLEIKKVYMGIVFLHGDKTEVLPVLQSTDGLEYEISRAVRKVTSASMPRIAFVTGHGEADLQQDLKNLNGALSREYTIEPITLSDIKEIPASFDAVLILSPRSPYSDWELYVLDKYVMQGGKLGVFLDKYDCDIQNNNCKKVETGLDDFLKNYGIGVNDDIVLDARCSRIGVQQQTGFFRVKNMVDFRYFPLVTNLDEGNIIVKGLDGIVFTFASSLDTTVQVPDSVSREVFAWTSELSRTETAGFDLNPYRDFRRSDFDRQSIPLAAVLRGEFPGYFADKPIPEYTGSDSSDSSFIMDSLPSPKRSVNTRMVVMGDGDLVKDSYLASKNNLVFFMNIVDWLSQDEGLISIRSKSVAERPLDDVSGGVKAFTKYFNIVGMPIVVLLYGLTRWRMRRSNKKRLV